MEHMELVKKAYAGDKLSRAKLMEENTGLIWSVVNRFQNRGYEKEDLYQIGCIGLIKAIDRFDVRFNVAFSTYAVPMILGEIRRFLRDDGLLKVGRKLKENQGKINAARQKYMKLHGMEPDLDWISKESGLLKEEIVDAIGYERGVLSYDRKDETERTLLETIGNEEDFTQRIEDRLTIQQALDKLEKVEQKIIRLRYYENKTQQEVGTLLKISQVRVSRMEKKIIQKMRISMVSP